LANNTKTIKINAKIRMTSIEISGRLPNDSFVVETGAGALIIGGFGIPGVVGVSTGTLSKYVFGAIYGIFGENKFFVNEYGSGSENWTWS
jgi:hypothetical protein